MVYFTGTVKLIVCEASDLELTDFSTRFGQVIFADYEAAFSLWVRIAPAAVRPFVCHMPSSPNPLTPNAAIWVQL